MALRLAVHLARQPVALSAACQAVKMYVVHAEASWRSICRVVRPTMRIF